ARHPSTMLRMVPLPLKKGEDLYFGWNLGSPVRQRMKANSSASSWSRWARVEPMPWPASVSTRRMIGFFDEVAACSRAVILVGSHDETRGSLSPVVSITEG